LSVPWSRSTAMNVAMFWNVESITPVATMPGRKYWVNGMPGPTVAPCWPKTAAKIPSMITG
jgi:hypothetical protein